MKQQVGALGARSKISSLAIFAGGLMILGAIAWRWSFATRVAPRKLSIIPTYTISSGIFFNVTVPDCPPPSTIPAGRFTQDVYKLISTAKASFDSLSSDQDVLKGDLDILAGRWDAFIWCFVGSVADTASIEAEVTNAVERFCPRFPMGFAGMELGISNPVRWCESKESIAGLAARLSTLHQRVRFALDQMRRCGSPLDSTVIPYQSFSLYTAGIRAYMIKLDILSQLEILDEELGSVISLLEAA